MAMRRQSWTFEVAFIVLAGFATRGFSKSFTITNNCDYTVWPGVLSSAGSVAPESNGFELAPGQSRTMSAPAGWPSPYSRFFKDACPRAYSYAYDDATSTFTCAGGDTSYDIVFCPSTASVKSVGSDPGMVYAGGAHVASSAPRVGAAPWLRPGAIVVGVALLASI
uniref:Thaumatin-like protein n=1 Tax=Oryza brachyantha TaxID=4533 RepID=J3LCH0_ORYBR